MKKKLIISSCIVIVVLFLAAAGYLFGVSKLQSDGYKAAVKTDQAALSTSVDEAIRAANSKSFFDPDVNATDAKNALKKSNDAANHLDAKIQGSEEGLTDFSELPFIATANANYRTVLDVQALEKQYISVSKEYLKELKAVNKYSEQTLPILMITEQLKGTSAKMERAGSVEEIMAVIDEFIATLDKADKIITPLKPADSVKELHGFNAKSIRELSEIMKQMKPAVVAQDVEQLMKLSQAYEEKSNAIEKQSKALAVKEMKQSKLTKLGNKLNELNEQIVAKIALW